MPLEQGDRSRLVNVTILFADLLDSVNISAVLDFWAYDQLIAEYQEHLMKASDEVGPYHLAERYVAGDQLCVFLYDRAQVERNRELVTLPADDPRHQQLEKENEKALDDTLFGALRAAIILKNAWLAAPVNFERVRSRHMPFDIGIGIHTGLCVLGERSDGTERIEGFAINFAKRIETYSRMGYVTRLMLSRGACQRLRFVKRRNVVMRQRLGFVAHVPPVGELKGLQAGLELFELKFFHRLAIYPPAESIGVFEDILRMDPKNIYAYLMAVEHFAYREGDLDRARELALQAHVARPDCEKVSYDLAYIALKANELKQAKFYAERVLEINREWDLVYGLLSDIERAGKGDPEKILDYQLRAYSLCPDSAQNCWDLASAFLHKGDKESARRYFKAALDMYPEYAGDKENADTLRSVGIEVPEAK